MMVLAALLMFCECCADKDQVEHDDMEMSHA